MVEHVPTRPAMASAVRMFSALCALILFGLGAILQTRPALARDTADPDRLVIASDPWCPYVCDPAATGRDGYMIDILRAVLEPEGVQVESRMTSWTVARRMFEEGRTDALLGIARSDHPDILFPRQPLGRAVHAFAFRRDDPFRWTGPDALDGRVLAIVKGYGFTGPMADYVKRHRDDPARLRETSGFGYNNLARNLRDLADRKVDLAFDNHDVLTWTVKGLGLEGAVALAPTDAPDELFVAFRTADPKAARYARLLDEGVERLRRSGRLANILAGYGLQDWEPADR